MIMWQAMIWTNKPDPGRTEAAETVCRDVLLRVKQDSHNLLEPKYSKLKI